MPGQRGLLTTIRRVRRDIHVLALVGATMVLVCAHILAASGTAAASEAPGTAFGEPCTKNTLIAARGSGENTSQDFTTPQGMLFDHVTQGIGATPGTLRIHWIGYPAFRPAGLADLPKYSGSVATGTDMTKSTMQYYARQCPTTRFVLAGYSQGAQVLGDVAADFGDRRDLRLDPARIVGVFLLADPRRDHRFRPTLGTHDNADGVAHFLGQFPRTFGALNGRTTEYCVTRDPVCDAGWDVSVKDRLPAELGTNGGPHTTYFKEQVPGATDRTDTYTRHMTHDIEWILGHSAKPVPAPAAPVTPPGPLGAVVRSHTPPGPTPAVVDR